VSSAPIAMKAQPGRGERASWADQQTPVRDHHVYLAAAETLQSMYRLARIGAPVATKIFGHSWGS